ncbi:MAG: hypothetical protein OXC95_15015 [Dehalococcoidia bacterium]|nr:hypothetical protein [Dehalococcoidia bacterium]
MAVHRSAAYVGRAIYNKTIRDKVEPTEKGKVVVIDVNSGDWEIDTDDATALFRLLERRPDAFTWAERVGYTAVYDMGSRFAAADFSSDMMRDQR